ncbi:MAG: peptidylprolyl isomerase [Gemmatimonadales bacterium]|jgi:hypothetical protein
MRWFVVGVVVFAVTGCGLRDTLLGRAGVVAETTEHEFTVTELAALMAEGGERVPLRREIAEQIVHRWVEYMLFADRIVAGDSLLDSATVLHAYWPDLDQMLIDAYRDRLMGERVRVDSAVVDSAFRAGNFRLIDHVLVRTAPDMAPPERDSAHAKAERLHGLAVAGRWEDANAENDDRGARRRGGSLGVLTRGAMVDQFEEAAFALEPGAISDVVETRFGYHIVRRRELDEVWDEYEASVREELEARVEDAFLEELLEEWRAEVRSSAPGDVREAANAPLQALRSPRVLATYRGGQFTTADLVRWIQALPPQVFQGVQGASDADLREFALELVQREVLTREAVAQGTTLPDSVIEDYTARLRVEVNRLRRVLELDSLMARVTDPRERVIAAETVVEAYLGQMVSDKLTPTVVPAFLADKLLREQRWSVSSPGLDQAVERAQRIRSEILSTPPPTPQPAPDTAVSPPQDDEEETDGEG